MYRNHPFNVVVLRMITLCLLGVFNGTLQQTVKKLDLFEGDVCRKRNLSEPEYVCQRAENCHSIEKNFENKNYPDICMFDGSQPIFCCRPKLTQITTSVDRPLVKRLSVANQMCRQYADWFRRNNSCNGEQFTCLNGKCKYSPWHSDIRCDGINDCKDGYDENATMCATRTCEAFQFKCLSGFCILMKDVCNGKLDCKDGSDENVTLCKDYWTKNKLINAPSYSAYAIFGYLAEPQEFAHMAVIGFGETIDRILWGCGGSLVNERWILSAAHCQQMGELMVNWVRLGDLNIVSTTDDARPMDYRIVERVIHPGYKKPSHYNDIALFRLETDVKFTKYVWPICLNSNPSVDPTIQITATGWGRTSADGPTSDHLIKVYLHIFSAEQCNNSYFSNKNKRLQYGIMPDSVICAGSSLTGADTCAGDSGGPLQIKNNDFTNMYTQIGVTSFGKLCGDKNTPGVYTRVSKFISWIEGIVWPVNL